MYPSRLCSSARYRGESPAAPSGSAKTYSVYVDGRPAPFVSSMSAEPDASTEIRLSEIYRDYICAEGKGFFYEFALEKKEKEMPQKKER